MSHADQVFLCKGPALVAAATGVGHLNPEVTQFWFHNLELVSHLLRSYCLNTLFNSVWSFEVRLIASNKAASFDEEGLPWQRKLIW